MFFCILDSEYEREAFKTCPHLYGIGLRNERFSTPLFWFEIMRSFITGATIWLFCFYGFDGWASFGDGTTS
jgi:hypothetical protein